MKLTSVESFANGISMGKRYINATSGELLPDTFIPLDTDTVDIAPTPIPNWDALQDRLLSGDLYTLFARLTGVAMEDSRVSTAQAHISMAVLNVRNERALQAGLFLLVSVAEYVLTNEEKTLWNNAISEEGFSDLVSIP